MPQPFTVEKWDSGSPLASFDQAGNLVLAGQITQNGEISGGQVIVPPGTTAGALQANNNLSDVPNPALARANLGIPSSSLEYGPAGYGLASFSIDPQAAQNTSSISNNTVWYVRIPIPANTSFSNVWWAVAAVGTGSAAGNTIGLYSDTGTLLDSIGSVPALWAPGAAGWVGGALAGGAQPAQSTLRYVYLAGLVTGMTTGPSWTFPASANDTHGPWAAIGPAGGNRRTAYATGSSLPASITPTSVGTATGYLPVCGVS
jgi:uncharacterized membrane protein